MQNYDRTALLQVTSTVRDQVLWLDLLLPYEQKNNKTILRYTYNKLMKRETRLYKMLEIWESIVVVNQAAILNT